MRHHCSTCKLFFYTVPIKIETSYHKMSFSVSYPYKSVSCPCSHPFTTISMLLSVWNLWSPWQCFICS